MAPVSLGSTPPPVGLDIGTDHIRAIQIKPAGAGFAATAYGQVAMPFGAVIEGEIVDPESVSSAIRELWKRFGIRSKEVAIGVSNQKVVVRLIDLPYMQRDELVGAIQYQAQDYIPIPVEEAILDFQIVGDYLTPSDEHMMEVLLVAAQKDMIGSAVSAVEGAGLKLMRVDVTAFALVRSLLGAGGFFLDESAESSAAVGIVDITAGLTNIVVAEKGIPRFTRVSALAGTQFSQAVANVLNLTLDEAEEVKIQAGLPSIDGTPNPAVGSMDPQVLAVAQEALEREANKFIAEVRRSLDYYLTQATQVRTIERIYLTGQGAMIRNLSTYLEKGLQTQVVLGDPLQQVTSSGGVEQQLLADRMGCAAAVGLAIGGAA